jgi:hypothetical protein
MYATAPIFLRTSSAWRAQVSYLIDVKQEMFEKANLLNRYRLLERLPKLCNRFRVVP